MGRTHFAFTALAAVCTFFTFSMPGGREARAYTPTVTPRGVPIRLMGEAKLDLVGNTKNKSGISEKSFYEAVVHGLQRWKAASLGSLSFDYWQGTDPKTYEPNSDYNGQSSIYFASNAAESGMASNVLGLTQVWYNTDTGEILEADIVLNDQAYRFSTDPRDTSGYGSAAPLNESADQRKVFIENVITHELGHALGLSHSGGLQSTMLFMESPEQAYLGCDEQVAVRALYRGATAGSSSVITGAVVNSDNGAPIFGAHVVAISQRRGTAIATAITDPQGRYTLASLEPGAYVLMVEPFFAGASALPSYYSAIDSAVCAGGSGFGRTFLTGSDESVPQSIVVGPGQIVSAPRFSARCEHSAAGAQVSSIPNATLVGDAPIVADFGGGRAGSFAFLDRAEGDERFYRIRDVAGNLELKALSYSLYSPVAVSLSLVDASGAPVQAESTEQIYVGTSGYVNRDAGLVARGLVRGDYWLRVRSARLVSTQYPAGPVSLDSVPFVLVTGSSNEAQPSSALAYNARCRMEEDFAAYTSPPGLPIRHSTDDEQVGFCGSIGGSGGSDSGSDGGGTGAAAILGWLLPWLFMGATALSARRSTTLSL